MIKTISKIGNSKGIILDSALLQLAKLDVGDQVNIEIHSGGTITISPIRDIPSEEEVKAAIDQTMKEYSDTLNKLAQ